SVFGVVFIGNIWEFIMFGIVLLAIVYSTTLFGVDIEGLYIPHGFMIGAGIVALIQVLFLILNKDKTQDKKSEKPNFTRSEKDITQGFGYGSIAYFAISLLLALTTGIYT